MSCGAARDWVSQNRGAVKLTTLLFASVCGLSVAHTICNHLEAWDSSSHQYMLMGSLRANNITANFGQIRIFFPAAILFLVRIISNFS